MTGYLPKHVVTIHSNYFDTGLAAVSTGKLGVHRLGSSENVLRHGLCGTRYAF